MNGKKVNKVTICFVKHLWAIFMALYQIWRMDVIKNKPSITVCFAGYIYRRYFVTISQNLENAEKG